jgi:hypothetical protein
MNRFTLGKRLALMALVGGVCLGVPAATAAQESNETTLELSADAQSPGSVALISLTLRVPQGVAVGKAVSEISFPAKVLTLEEARRGLSAEGAGADVSAETLPPSGDTATIRITVTAKPGEPLPSGAIAELRLKVLDDAPNEVTVPLKIQASAWSDTNPPKPLAPVVGKDGEVEVTANPPVFACFFYMH